MSAILEILPTAFSCWAPSRHGPRACASAASCPSAASLVGLWLRAMSDPPSDLGPARAILETLIGFDTTSRNSNLALVDWVEAYLDGHGVPHRRVPNADGTKSNLLATIGPAIEGGAVLS